MPRETAEILEDITALLRQYVDRTTEMSKRAEERLARVTPPRMDFRRDIKDVERASQEAAKRRSADEAAFRERLFGLLEAHNRTLGQLLRAQAKDGKAKAKKKHKKKKKNKK